MNLFSAVEQLAVSDCFGVRLNSSRCVRKLDKTASCTLCIDTCPVGAIQLDKPIALNETECVRCGLCLHLCPVEAFSGEDGVVDLLTCVSRLETARTIELTCAVHPEPEPGPAQVDAVIRVTGCLGSLGNSAWLGLLALGVEKITVRLDVCAQCPFGAARQTITRVIATTNAILSAYGKTEQIMAIADPAFDDPVRRPVTEAIVRPLSRRDIFRLAASGRSQVANRLLDETETVSSTDKQPPRERRRLINALRQLAQDSGGIHCCKSPSSPLPFIRLNANNNCTACADCVKSCPTGAFELAIGGENDYKLIFSLTNCTDCGVCLALCKPGALHREPLSSVALSSNWEPMILREGILQYCTRCGIQFTGETAIGLCPQCDFRHQNPFGRRPSGH